MNVRPGTAGLGKPPVEESPSTARTRGLRLLLAAAGSMALLGCHGQDASGTPGPAVDKAAGISRQARDSSSPAVETADPPAGATTRFKEADPDFDPRVASPAYVTVHPRVLIDEAHHNFHKAGGRYKPFADLIQNDGYAVASSSKSFSMEVLGRCDILVIANALGAEPAPGWNPDMARPAFSQDECAVVQAWVDRGGALLLITDHYPYGWAARDLAQRFGVEMGKVFTMDPANSRGDPSQLLFSRKNQLLGDHPITRGRDESERINRVLTFTGQSIKGPAGSSALLKLADTAFDLTYPEKNQLPAAGRAQGVVLTYGKGRVVVLGEANQLTAVVKGPGRTKLGMNLPGIDNRQFALNIMHWLSRLIDPEARPPSRP